MRKVRYGKMPKKFRGFWFYDNGNCWFIVNSRYTKRERANTLGFMIDKQEETKDEIYILMDDKSGNRG